MIVQKLYTKSAFSISSAAQQITDGQVAVRLISAPVLLIEAAVLFRAAVKHSWFAARWRQACECVSVGIHTHSSYGCHQSSRKLLDYWRMDAANSNFNCFSIVFFLFSQNIRPKAISLFAGLQVIPKIKITHKEYFSSIFCKICYLKKLCITYRVFIFSGTLWLLREQIRDTDLNEQSIYFLCYYFNELNKKLIRGLQKIEPNFFILNHNIHFILC